LSSIVLDEESLSDALVHHNKSDFRRVLALVVDLIEHFLELGDLLSDDLISHGITDTISVDDVVCWQKVPSMLFCKGSDSFLEGFLHLVLNNFLTLPLNKIFRVILTHLFVDGASKTDNGVWTGVADIDTNEHGSHVIESSWELEVEQISASLAVDLSQDVAGLRWVEGLSISSSDHLRWDVELLENLFVHLVLVLIAKDHDNHGWVSEH